MNKFIRILMVSKFKKYLNPKFRVIKRDLLSHSGNVLDCYVYLIVNQKGIFEIYYYGKILRVTKFLLSLRFKLKRLSDKSMVSLFLTSPYINNFFIFSGKR